MNQLFACYAPPDAIEDRWTSFATVMPFGNRSLDRSMSMIPQDLNPAILGNPPPRTTTHASASETWGSSAAGNFICCSPLVARWENGSWETTSLLRLRNYPLELQYLASLDYPSAFVRTLFERSGSVLVPRYLLPCTSVH